MTGALLLQCRVHGTPAPQGSKRHVGKGIMVESSKKVKPWREAVKTAALDATHLGSARIGSSTLHAHTGTEEGAVDVSLVFVLDRPKGHYRTGRNAHLLRDGAPTVPTVKPDLDKLVRSTLDAIKDAGVYRDDSQVVSITTTKVYASPLNGIPGATIIVRSIP
jgi:crossover junction endodeoxyribonuclease RusA